MRNSALRGTDRKCCGCLAKVSNEKIAKEEWHQCLPKRAPVPHPAVANKLYGGPASVIVGISGRCQLTSWKNHPLSLKCNGYFRGHAHDQQIEPEPVPTAYSNRCCRPGNASVPITMLYWGLVSPRPRHFSWFPIVWRLQCSELSERFLVNAYISGVEASRSAVACGQNWRIVDWIDDNHLDRADDVVCPNAW